LELHNSVFAMQPIANFRRADVTGIATWSAFRTGRAAGGASVGRAPLKSQVEHFGG